VADVSVETVPELVAVTVRTIAVPLDLLPESERGPCQGCDYRAPAPLCAVMRPRVQARGLPDCAGGFVYREVIWEQF